MGIRVRAALWAAALLLLLAAPGAGHAQSDQTITIGQRVSGRLETPVSIANFRFQGAAGLPIRIRITGEPGVEPAARLEVDNREVWFGGAPGGTVVDSGSLTLESGNQYLLQIRTANGRAGGFTLETAREGGALVIGAGGQLTPGAPVGGWLPGPSSGQTYTLPAQAGQTLLVSVRTSENLTARITVQAPDGLVLWSERAQGPNRPLTLQPLRLAAGGTYQIYITAGGSTGGTYELTAGLSQ